MAATTERRGFLPDLGIRNFLSRAFLNQTAEVLPPVDPRHPKERGYQGHTAITALEGTRLDTHLATTKQIKEIGQDLTLNLLGPSARDQVWLPDEGLAASTVVDVVAGTSRLRQATRLAADLQVEQQIGYQLAALGHRTQVPTYADLTEGKVNTRHLIDDTTTSFATDDIESIIRLGQNILTADEKIGSLPDSGVKRLAVLNYVFTILHLNTLTPSEKEEIEELDVDEIEERAQDQVETQFLHMLFTGTVDQRVSLDLIRLHKDMKIDLVSLVPNPAAYAMATFAESSPFSQPNIQRAYSELDLSYAEAMRQLTEYAYLHAVSELLFPAKSPIVIKLGQTLAHLAQVGRFRSDDRDTVKKIRSAYLDVEQHIYDVMVDTVGVNVMNYAQAIAKTPHNIVKVLEDLEHFSPGQIREDVSAWGETLAKNFATNTNVGDVIHIPKRVRTTT